MANEKLVVDVDVKVNPKTIIVDEMKRQLVRSMQALQLPVQNLAAQLNIQPEAVITPGSRQKFQKQAQARLKELDKALAATQADGFVRPTSGTKPADQLKMMDPGDLAAMRQSYAMMDRMLGQLSDSDQFTTKKFLAVLKKAKAGMVLAEKESQEMENYLRYLQGNRKTVESIGSSLASAKPSYVSVTSTDNDGKPVTRKVAATQTQFGTVKAADLDNYIRDLTATIATSRKAAEVGGLAGKSAEKVLAEQARQTQETAKQTRASARARRAAITITDDDRSVLANIKNAQAGGFKGYNLGSLGADAKVIEKMQMAAALDRQGALGPRGGNTAASLQYGKQADELAALAKALRDLPRSLREMGQAAKKTQDELTDMEQKLRYATGRAMYNRKGRAAAGPLLGADLDRLDIPQLEGRYASANAADSYLSEQLRRVRQRRLSGVTNERGEEALDRLEGRYSADRAEARAIRKEIEERLTGVHSLKEMNAAQKKYETELREQEKENRARRSRETKEEAQKRRDDLKATQAKKEENARLLGQRAMATRANLGDLTGMSPDQANALLDGLKTGKGQLQKDRTAAGAMYGINSAEYQSKDKDYKQVSKDIDDVNARLRTMAKESAQAEREASKLKTGMNQLSDVMQLFVRYALFYGAFYAVLNGVRALISGVIDLEKQLKSIQAVAGATADEMAGVNASIKEVAATTKYSLTEVANATQTLVQAGVLTKDIDTVLRSTANFAQATETSLTVAADVITSLRDVYKDMSDAKLADQLTKTINLSKLTGEGLKTIVSLGAQVGSSYGLESEQFLAASAVLRNAGLKESTAGTGLRQAILEMFSPDRKTTAALEKRYAELGETLTGPEIQKKFNGFTKEASPLIAVLKELRRLGLGGEGDSAFSRIFDIRAENAIKALVANLEDLEATETRIALGSPALSASRTQMEAMANQLDNLRGAMTVLADALLADFIPGLTSGVRTLAEEINKLSDANTDIKSLTGYGFASSALSGVGTGLAAAALAQGSVYKKAAAFGAGAVIGTGGSMLGTSSQADSGSSTAVNIGNALGTLASLMAVVQLFGKGRGSGGGVDLKSALEGAKNLPTLMKFFAGAWMQKIQVFFQGGTLKAFQSALGLLFRLMGGLPGLLATAGIAGATYLLSGDSKEAALQNARNKQAKQASASQQAEEQLANYATNSAGGTAEGTTARAVREFELLSEATDNALNRAFKGLEATSEIRSALERMGKQGQEKGSAAQQQIASDVDAVLAQYGTGLDALGITTDTLADLSAKFVEMNAKAKGMRADFTQTLKLAAEQEKTLLADEKNGKFSAELQMLREARKRGADGQNIFGRLTGPGDILATDMAEIARTLLKGITAGGEADRVKRLNEAVEAQARVRKAFTAMLQKDTFASEKMSSELDSTIELMRQSGMDVHSALAAMIKDVDAKLQRTKDYASKWYLTTDPDSYKPQIAAGEAAKKALLARKAAEAEAEKKYISTASAEVRGNLSQAFTSLDKLSPEQFAKLNPEDQAFLLAKKDSVRMDKSGGFESGNIDPRKWATLFPQAKRTELGEDYSRVMKLLGAVTAGLQADEDKARADAEDAAGAANDRYLNELAEALQRLQNQRKDLVELIDQSKETVEGTKEILKPDGLSDDLKKLDDKIARAAANLTRAEANVTYTASKQNEKDQVAKEKKLRDAGTAETSALQQSVRDQVNRTTDVIAVQAGLVNSIKGNYQEILGITAERNKEEAEALGNLEDYMLAFNALSGKEVDARRAARDKFVSENAGKPYVQGKEVYNAELAKLEAALQDAEARRALAASKERSAKSTAFTELAIERIGQKKDGEAADEFYGRPVTLDNQRNRLEAELAIRRADQKVQTEEYDSLWGLANAGDQQASAGLAAQADAVQKSAEAVEMATVKLEDYRRTNEQVDGAVRAVYDSLTKTDWGAAVGDLKASAVETEAVFRDGLLSVVDQMGDKFADVMLGMGDRTESFSKRFKRLMRSALEDLSRFLIKQAFMGAIQQGIGIVTGMFGGGAGATGGPTAVKGGVTYLGISPPKRDGGVMEGFADGGIISGAGTGRSDSIYGSVLSADGRRKKGVKLSNGEAILNARAVRELGKSGVDALNMKGASALQGQAVTMVNQLPSVSNQSVSISVPISLSAGGGAEGGDGGVTKDQTQQLSRMIEIRMIDLLKTQMRPGGLLNKGRRN